MTPDQAELLTLWRRIDPGDKHHLAPGLRLVAPGDRVQTHQAGPVSLTEVVLPGGRLVVLASPRQTLLLVLAE